MTYADDRRQMTNDQGKEGQVLSDPGANWFQNVMNFGLFYYIYFLKDTTLFSCY